MSRETIAILVFIVIAFTWIVYLLQELFIAGASALNMSICKNEEERKQVQVITGMHFDGMEVWFIAAVTLMIGAFPLVYGTIFTYLYVIFFLLLYALIARGVSIEVIYKLDSKKWVKAMVIAWTVSSILILFILGVYLTNLFYGFPLDAGGMTSSYISMFNVTALSGGAMFVLLGLAAGAGWIGLNTEGELGERAVKFIKSRGIIYPIPITLLLVFMGFNNTEASIFIGELFSKSFLFFLLPLLTVVFATLTTYMGYLEKAKKMFIFSLLTMFFFLVTGYVGTYPYMILSNVDMSHGITLTEAMVSKNALTVIFVSSAIFFPLIVTYQTWKYMRFTDKIKLNDE